MKELSAANAHVGEVAQQTLVRDLGDGALLLSWLNIKYLPSAEYAIPL